MPEALVRILLLRGWIIQPGLETSAPQLAVSRYGEVLGQKGYPLKGRRVLVFGYGGRFDIGLGLLEAGASHVVLCDPLAPPDDRHNLSLAADYGQYFSLEGRRARPRPEYITLLSEDVRTTARAGLAPFDAIVSNSVFEHVDDVPGVTRALAALTRPDGVQLHFIDLRDHYFKYPFEMLTFSERVWKRWLNPTSNLNRHRLEDYRRIFANYFRDVEVTVLERDEERFNRVRARIRPQFLSGDPDVDSATVIRVLAASPVPK